MSDTELKRYVEIQREKRILIKKEINQLDKKRRAYIAKQKNESTKKNELESVILQAIKKQAERKNYTW